MGFIRRALGVRDSTPTKIMMRELDRIHMWVFWLLQCVKLWNKLIDLEESDLTRCCLHQNWELVVGHDPQSPAVQGCWVAQLCHCLVSLGVITSSMDLQARVGEGWALQGIDLERVEAAAKVWCGMEAVQPSDRDPRQVVASENFKCVTYAAWFSRAGGTDRTKAFTSSLRRRMDIVNVARLRMGSHSLNIERQRWGSGRLARAQRLCQVCAMGMVEDELHFMLECPRYDDLRQKLFEARGLACDLQPTGENMRCLMNGDSHGDWNAIAGFLREALKLRDRVMNEMRNVV